MLNWVLQADAPISERLFAVGEVFLRECVVSSFPPSLYCHLCAPLFPKKSSPQVGVLVGLVMGYIAYLAIQAVDEPVLEITITVVLVGMIEVLCVQIDASIPLASICAGLLIGNYGVVSDLCYIKLKKW